jgi:hypothetical protein
MSTFLSYHHQADGDAAALLTAALQQAGIVVFQDVKDLRSGDRWMARLQHKLAECSAFVVLVGRDGIARWVAGEVEAALNRHFGPHDDAQRLTLHPVLLPGAGPESLPPFLALFQAERWVPGEPLPAGLLQALRERSQRAHTAPLIDPGRCPYMGLASFGADDAQLFFGRRQETLAALRSLGDASDGDPIRQRTTGPSHTRWLQVEGHSGSGKSSLVKAGLLPMLRQVGALWARTGFAHAHVLGPLLPGAKPVERLAEALEHGLTDEVRWNCCCASPRKPRRPPAPQPASRGARRSRRSRRPGRRHAWREGVGHPVGSITRRPAQGCQGRPPPPGHHRQRPHDRR